ncbi:hypothetical protein E1B28_008969 [Marasmius oreades]|uniref:Uncharacterized protein n=1 Tax=Marasmius oreades TaxID=181124 RepID=A0A9P7UTT9_9AGAR|nr:uncharacterized protein E1B28_008969 [Marasmius oreades]KAG7092626.1 hypothetical protein E1B28_008969 [Marasmius oreades]
MHQYIVRPCHRRVPRIPPAVRLLAPHLFPPSKYCRPHKRPGRSSFKRGRLEYLKRLEIAKKHWEKKASTQPTLRGNALVLLERGPSPLSSISNLSAWNDESREEEISSIELYYRKLRASTHKTLWQHNARLDDYRDIYDVESDSADNLAEFSVLNHGCQEEHDGMDLGLQSSDVEMLAMSPLLSPPNDKILGWEEEPAKTQPMSQTPAEIIIS